MLPAENILPLAGLILVGIASTWMFILLWTDWRRGQLSTQRGVLELKLITAEIEASCRARTSKAESEHGWNGWRKFRVVERVAETSDVCSFYFKPHDGKPIPSFFPGQYLTFSLNLSGNTKPLIRCYSLSDAPSLDYYRVSIKRLRAPLDKPDALPGKGSSYFHDCVKEGDILDVKAPGGHFFLSPAEQRPLCLLSAGIGITPVLSMLLEVTKQTSNREVWFFHGVRHSKELVQGPCLKAIAQENPNVRIVICFSDPLPEDQIGITHDVNGRVSVHLLKKYLPSNNYAYFLCGPGPFMESLVTGLGQWGVPDVDVNFEAFGPSTVKRNNAAKKTLAPFRSVTEKPLTISFSKSSQSVTWDNKCTSLLDVADSLGIEIASGCRAGNCGTCLTAVKQGEVEYVQPAGSPPESGSCLVCIARPKTDLILDV